MSGNKTMENRRKDWRLVSISRKADFESIFHLGQKFVYSAHL